LHFSFQRRIIIIMSSELSATRLYLVALTFDQLRLCLPDLKKLEAEMGFPISRDIIDSNVVRAINMKLEKMARIDKKYHDWFTCWLIVIRAKPAGAGFIGFKGLPDENGKAEIGYGIDAGYHNQGYMTEALKALTEWAFRHPQARALTATAVSNPASERVLQKSGWQKMRQGDQSSDWEISK
jgi:[ribosomal protein S5]-alanine N-acetyltransferase